LVRSLHFTSIQNKWIVPPTKNSHDGTEKTNRRKDERHGDK
jgi:hypothetical protein